MKIFNRDFVFPLLICSTSLDSIGKKILEIQIFKDDEIYGVLNYKVYVVKLIIKNKKYQWRAVWRPRVTKYWWIESKKRREGKLK